MKLSTKTRYGIRLLLDLARYYDQGPVQIGDIAKRQDISVKYLEQIVRPLKKAGFVCSIRGPKGGHILGKAPEEISLDQIVRLLENETDLVECVTDHQNCARSNDCSVRLVWQEANRAFYEKLQSITITDLLANDNTLERDETTYSLRSKDS